MGHVSSFSLFAATVLGAIALLMMMPRPGGVALRRIGAVLGAATLGGFWLWLARFLPDLGANATPFAYYYVFSAIAIIGGVRVITHTRPVYSALWFVMVILASAGLLLVLAAEFIAFALVIIYGGAILVTYVFVIMLASQATEASDDSTAPAYDRIAREPLAATVVGFLLLAMLLHMATIERPSSLERLEDRPEARLRVVADSDSIIELTTLPRRAPARVLERLRPEDREHLAAEFEPASPVKPLAALLSELGDDDEADDGPDADDVATDLLEAWEEAGRTAAEYEDELPHTARRAVAETLLEAVEQRFSAYLDRPLEPAERARLAKAIANHRRVDNIERIGLDLFEGNPLGLELAGVILLVALIGAVLIARQRVTDETGAGG